ASFLSVSVEQSATRDIRRALFAKLQQLSLGFYHGNRSGALISRVTNDVEAVRGALAAGISNLLKDGLTLVGCLVLVFLASWRMALFSMLVLPPAALALVAIGRKMRKRSGTVQERMGDLTGVLQESIAGARVVKAFGMERFEERRFERSNSGYYRAFVRLRRVSAAAKPLSEYAVIVVAVAIAWFGAREIFQTHSMPPERFFGFVTAMLATMSPVRSLSEVGGTIATGLGAARRVFALLDTPATVVDRPGAVSLPALSDAIRFESVQFAYESGDEVLHGVTLEVKRGEVVALVGASGAGKSTTLDLLARFYDPTGGRITWDGVDLRDAAVDSLRTQLGIVTQETILFHDSVRANIAYGRPDCPPAQLEAAARAAHAHAFIEKLPQGYDTLVGDRGVRLSGGERQRLAIARALLKNPPVMLLDEATSALDTESERLVQEALERLMRDRTVLVIAHRLSTVQDADRILVFGNGLIVESGTHHELLARDGTYRRLHALQFRD
ncbi:MAG: ABC transporter ATP-binding protein, partial [Candidatus Eisenbacteria bacterium]